MDSLCEKNKSLLNSQIKFESAPAPVSRLLHCKENIFYHNLNHKSALPQHSFNVLILVNTKKEIYLPRLSNTLPRKCRYNIQEKYNHLFF